MRFSKVDLIFKDWAKALNIPIQTDYKGEEVRSVDIVDNTKKRWQLWLEPVNDNDQCVIHYWNYKDISRYEKVSNSDLFEKLTEIGNNIISNNIPKAKLP